MPSGSAIRAGRAFVELFADDSKLVKTFERSARRIHAYGQTVAKLGQRMILLSTAMIAPLAVAIGTFSSVGDAAAKMATRTGLSVEAVTALGFAADRSGTSLDAFETGLKKMQKTIGDAATGGKASIKTIEQLGLTVEQLRGLKPEDQFKLIADRIDQIQDPTMKSAMAMKVFGRSGSDLIPLMAGGAAGIQKLMNEAKELGYVLSAEDGVAAEQLTDSIGDLKATMKGITIQVGAALAPAMTDLAYRIRDVGARVIGWLRNNRETVISVAKVALGVGALGSGLLVLGTVIKGLATPFIMLGGAIKGATAAATILAAHPVIAILAAVAIGATAAAGAMGLLTEATAELSNAQSDALSAGDQQRADDQMRLQRLHQLADQQSLSNDEQAEAASLIGTLTDRYGDLGLSIDSATGAITGMSTAQAALNTAMREAAFSEVQAQIAEIDANMRALDQQERDIADRMQLGPSALNLNGSMTLGLGELTGGVIGTSAQEVADQQAAARDQRRIQNARRAAAEARLAALQAGDAAALTGGAEGKDPSGLAVNAAAAAAEQEDALKRVKDAEQELADLEEREASKRRTRLQQELHDIDEVAREKLRLIDILLNEEKARGAAADAARVAALEAQKQAAEQTANAAKSGAIDRDRKEREKKEDAARQRRLDAERDVDDQIARARIDATMRGIEKDLALLEQERQQALRDALEDGGGQAAIDKVNELFDLRKTILGRSEVSNLAPKTSVSGTFSAAVASRGVSNAPLSRIAALNEQQLATMRRIERNQQDGQRFR